jgi:hypothetical protein
MRTRLIVGFAIGALGASTFACNSSSNPYAQPSEYCTAYAKAICQAGCQFDPATCQTYQEDQCNQLAQTEMTPGVRQYESANVQPCIDAVNKAYDNAAQVSAAQIANIDMLCARVFLGAAGEGAPCTSDFDCSVSGDICATAPGVATETCAKPTQKEIGDDCADRGDQCPANSYCAPQTGTSVCVVAQTAGQACTDTVKCNASVDQCLQGICQPLAGQGEPCSSDADCVAGFFCDPYTDLEITSRVCVSGYSFALGSNDCLGLEGRSTVPVDAGTSVGTDGGEGGSSLDGASGG